MTDRWENEYWELFLRHAQLWTLVAEMVSDRLQPGQPVQPPT